MKDRSTKLIIDNIREILQMSSPDIPGGDNALEKTLQDLAEVEKRHEMLLEVLSTNLKEMMKVETNP